MNPVEMSSAGGGHTLLRGATSRCAVSPEVTADRLDVLAHMVGRVEVGHGEAGHGARVGRMARRIAEIAGSVDADLAQRGGILHDVGKALLPFHPGLLSRALTKDERVVVQDHPRLGAHAARWAGEEEEVVDAILLHHERVDGSGYPFGLRGGRVPLLAQVVAAADIWDALLARRGYKPAWSEWVVEWYFSINRERWFASEVVAAFGVAAGFDLGSG